MAMSFVVAHSPTLEVQPLRPSSLRTEAGQAQSVQNGRITSIRYVRRLKAAPPQAPSLVAWLAASLATIGSVEPGAVAGSQAQKSRWRQLDFRYSGSEPNEPFARGERIRVLSNGNRTT